MDYTSSSYSALLVAICVITVPVVDGSLGDSSRIHRRCLDACVKEGGCGKESSPLGWTCSQNCDYECMWDTVEAFHSRGLSTPQFHGKWPFLRMWAVQEPAAALASLLNLIPHAVLIRRYRASVSDRSPMYRVWTLYAAVSINTWTWSTIFHTRDNNFTEKMDYLSAFSVVSYSLGAFFLRVFPSRFLTTKVGLLGLTSALFVQHVYYMGVISFDYGYNMMVNISVGALNSVCWLAWAASRWRTERAVVSHAVAAVLLLNLSILLEVLDFPPILWILDSHALWHFSTAPIHILWYRFITLDAIQSQDEEDLLKIA